MFAVKNYKLIKKPIFEVQLIKRNFAVAYIKLKLQVEFCTTANLEFWNITKKMWRGVSDFKKLQALVPSVT